jgi:Mg-chelatase subunit ChlD
MNIITSFFAGCALAKVDIVIILDSSTSVGAGNYDKMLFNAMNIIISFFSGCALAKVDIVIILDSSTSVGSGNYDKMKNFCKDFLQNADLDSGNVRVGILSYSSKVKIEFYLNSYGTFAEVADAIDKIVYRYGSTNTADSLKSMREEMFSTRNGDRDGVPDICIILTDGVSNINSRKTIPQAVESRAAGIHIYAIGIGLRDTRELDGMASEPASENSFNVKSFDELSVLSEKIFEAFCPGKYRTTKFKITT